MITARLSLVVLSSIICLALMTTTSCLNPTDDRSADSGTPRNGSDSPTDSRDDLHDSMGGPTNGESIQDPDPSTSSNPTRLSGREAVSEQEAVESSSQDGVNKAKKEMRIPDATLSGTVAGREFNLDYAELKSNILTLKQGEGVLADLGVVISLFSSQDQDKKEWLITEDSSFGNPHVRIMYKKEDDASFPEWKTHMEGYALRLELDDPVEGKVTGRMYLRVPGEAGANLAGKFVAELGLEFENPLEPWQRPWVISQVDLPDDTGREIAVGYIGRTSGGEVTSMFVGSQIEPGRAGAAWSENDSTVTAVGWSERKGVHGKHIKLQPGNYLFYVRHGDHYVTWQRAVVKADSMLELGFDLDPSDAGRLIIESDPSQTNPFLQVVPLNEQGEVLIDEISELRLAQMVGLVDVEEGRAVLDELAPGRYRILGVDEPVEVEVKTGEEVIIRLGDE